MQRILHYEISRELGRGKNGRTFQAVDTGQQRVVVLKSLADRHPADHNWFKALERDMRVWSAFDDARIGYFHGLEDVNGEVWLIREYVEGQTLAELSGDSGADYGQFLDIAVKVASVFRFIHDKGLVHGNLTAHNILVDTSGQIRLVDYGLGALPDDIIAERIPVDDLRYIAPEVLNGQPYTHQSDFHALGVAFMQLITGHLPFEGETTEVVRQQILKAPRNFDSIPSGSSREIARLLLGRLMAREPEERFGSADELYVTLTGMSSLESGQVELASESRTLFTSRHYLLVSVLILLLIILWLVITSPR